MMDEPHRRSIDTWLERANLFWNWVDARQIDRHVVAGIILTVSTWIVWWATHFADTHPDKTGIELAAIIGAVMVPWAPMQTFALKYWFESRDKP